MDTVLPFAEHKPFDPGSVPAGATLVGALAALNGRNRKKPVARWSAKLTRALTLKSGDELVTLSDARVVMTLYSEIGVESVSVALAIKRLLKAAETRGFEDRKAATDQVAIVLRLKASQTPVGVNV